MREAMGITGDIEDEQSRYFFNYCYELLSAWKSAVKADTFESLYGMSRSLFCLYSIMGGGIVLLYPIMRIYATLVQTERFIGAVAVCFLLAVVFLRRVLRFNRSRVKVVLRTYISLQVKRIDDLRIKDL